MLDLVWLAPALPLAGFVILLAFGKRLGEPLAGWLATMMTAGSFVAGLVVFAGLLGREAEERAFVQTLFEWVPAGDFSVDVGFLVDPLSMTMVLFVTGISALIHLYAIGYMHGDPRFEKFFLYLNLFVFSMLMLVLGDNLLLTFLGWEGVGACSYFLISFWFEKEANASAGKKAFVTNRVGDWGFMVAIFLTFVTFGSLQYVEVLAGAPGLAETTATAIAGLLFIGAVGKSAQIPLYIWLPDAMAGPTPVSALIHAATMVTAGVYLMVRINPILAVTADWLPTTIAWIGVLTALLAATIALAQTDIKKVLAYSTVSQLGFMFLAIGCGAYVAAVFHMVTHAFFKALLFLGSGSVIHGMGDEQDMRRMGALKKYLPITYGTFIIGWLAIAGVPPLSGFWSKDEILAFALDENPALFAVGLFTALLTAFYMSRQVFMVFYGDPRWNDDVAEVSGVDEVDEAGESGSKAKEHALSTATDSAAGEPAAGDGSSHGEVHPHESPWTMTTPLVVLAGLAAVGGILNLPFGHDWEFLHNWLAPSVPFEAELALSTGTKVALGVGSAVVALLGIAGAYLVYLKRRVDAARFEPELFARGWYIDWAYTAFMGGPGRKGFELTAAFDNHIIDGAVNGVGASVRSSGGLVRRVQNGMVRSYALGIGVGAVVLLGWFLFRAGI